MSQCGEWHTNNGFQKVPIGLYLGRYHLSRINSTVVFHPLTQLIPQKTTPTVHPAPEFLNYPIAQPGPAELGLAYDNFLEKHTPRKSRKHLTNRPSVTSRQSQQVTLFYKI